MKQGQRIRVDRGPARGREGRLTAIFGDDRVEIENKDGHTVVHGRHVEPEGGRAFERWFVIPARDGDKSRETVVDANGFDLANGVVATDSDLIAAAPELLAHLARLMGESGAWAGDSSDPNDPDQQARRLVERLMAPRAKCEACGGGGWNEEEADDCDACDRRGTVSKVVAPAKSNAAREPIPSRSLDMSDLPPLSWDDCDGSILAILLRSPNGTRTTSELRDMLPTTEMAPRVASLSVGRALGRLERAGKVRKVGSRWGVVR